jgi:quinol-cytochrome oxidoreductase complex cytochrome b subunit
MNWAHVHLMLTHIPVIGIGAILAFLVLGVIRRSREIQWASLQLFVALALLSIAVYLSGSPANHQVRDLPGFTRSVIHRHSTAADFAF